MLAKLKSNQWFEIASEKKRDLTHTIEKCMVWEKEILTQTVYCPTNSSGSLACEKKQRARERETWNKNRITLRFISQTAYGHVPQNSTVWEIDKRGKFVCRAWVAAITKNNMRIHMSLSIRNFWTNGKKAKLHYNFNGENVHSFKMEKGKQKTNTHTHTYIDRSIAQDEKYVDF